MHRVACTTLPIFVCYYFDFAKIQGKNQLYAFGKSREGQVGIVQPNVGTHRHVTWPNEVSHVFCGDYSTFFVSRMQKCNC